LTAIARIHQPFQSTSESSTSLEPLRELLKHFGSLG
jgi:hypothetical protein